MKLPRDVGARQLIKVLGKLGYQVTGQTGSHVRLACESPAAQREIEVIAEHHWSPSETEIGNGERGIVEKDALLL